MFGLKLISLTCAIAIVAAQDYQDFGPPSGGRHNQAPLRLNSGSADEAKAPPIAILKQINKHNEDGSYTYGYEGADGSFKIETKLATGEVKGKYGYVDETGKVRTVEYGANKYGFQPVGEGITVAPPTLVDETTDDYDELGAPQQQQQYQQPKPVSRVAKPRPQYVEQPQPQRPQYFDYEQPAQPQQAPPQPRPKYSGSPVPPRPQIPNAVPIDVVYSPRPRPARPEPEYDVRPQTFPSSQPSFIPAPQQPKAKQIAYTAPRLQQQPQQHQQPEPQQYQQAQFAPQPRPQGRSTSVLDQLAIDYALPQGGSQALHDISFGYY